MKYVILLLFSFCIYLNYLLWFNSGTGVDQVQTLTQVLAQQKEENIRLHERNKALEADIVSLQNDLAALEELARSEMGLIKKDETFYHVLTPEKLPEK